MRRAFKSVFVILALASASTLAPTEGVSSENVWNFDSATPGAAQTERSGAQEVYRLVLKQIVAWNSQDIEGFMSAYWKNPKLVYLDDGEQIFGWDALHANYLNGFSDRSLMGYLEAQRVKIQMLAPDMAYVLLWWDMLVGRPRTKVIGTSTLVVRQLTEGWKIVASHTNSLEP